VTMIKIGGVSGYCYFAVVGQTEVTYEMNKRLGDVICLAPWTKLDLSCRVRNGDDGITT